MYRLWLLFLILLLLMLRLLCCRCYDDCCSRCAAAFISATTYCFPSVVVFLGLFAGWFLLCAVQGHTARVNAVDTTGNGLFVASASADFTIRLWKAMDSFACVGTYYTSAMDGALLSVSMGLRSFVCSSQKGVIRQFPLLGELPVCGPLTGIVCCRVTVLQGCVACVADPTVRVVSSCSHTVFKLHSHRVQIAFTPCPYRRPPSLSRCKQDYFSDSPPADVSGDAAPTTVVVDGPSARSQMSFRGAGVSAGGRAGPGSA